MNDYGGGSLFVGEPTEDGQRQRILICRTDGGICELNGQCKQHPKQIVNGTEKYLRMLGQKRKKHHKKSGYIITDQPNVFLKMSMACMFENPGNNISIPTLNK